MATPGTRISTTSHGNGAGGALAQAAPPKRAYRAIVPSWRDPRWTLAFALSLWTLLGQTFLYFDRDPRQIAVCILAACGVDFLLAFLLRREILVPISAYITGLSVGILLESYDWRVFAVACTWGIASKYFLRSGNRHFFNPSNFAIVSGILLSHGIATVAPGSQWGGDFRVAILIMGLGLMMMKRVRRLDLVVAWLSGYVAMSLLRVALGQGGLVFALGPMTGAEFTLFTFSMLPDPKTNPPTPGGRIVWGLLIAFADGVLRFLEVRYSMFYALFGFCAVLPLFRLAAAARGVSEPDPWKTVVLVLKSASGRQPRAVAGPATTLPSKPGV